MIPLREHCWPLIDEPSDEWAGDEWLDDLPSGFPNYRNLYRGLWPLTPERYAALDRRFLEIYRGILRGDRPWNDPALIEVGEPLMLLGEPAHDRRPLPKAPCAVSDALLCDLVENYVPDTPLIANDRILGPWADLSPERPLVRAAAAVCALTLSLKGEIRVPRRWGKDRPRPPVPLRDAVRAVYGAPAMLWAIRGGDWTPLLPLAPAFVPPPGRSPPPPAARLDLPDGASARFAVARVYRLAGGSWAASAAIGLPEPPPVGAVIRRLRLELLRLRRHERRSTWEDLLRRRPEVLYRTCAAWTWHRSERRELEAIR